VLTVEGGIRLIVPAGTRGTGNWHEYPQWPPDMFAIAAFLLEQSGSYAWLRPRYIESHFNIDVQRRQQLVDLGREWARGDWFLRSRSRAARRSGAKVAQLWATLWANRARPLTELAARQAPPAWTMAALYLLIVADEASVGIGFFPPSKEFASEERKSEENRGGRFIQMLAMQRFFFPPGPNEPRTIARTHTVGWYADPNVACVLPKTRTPRVGCTVRSLSHHLSLLPGRGELRASWHVNPTAADRPDVFNVLMIPFPYRISGNNFRVTQRSDSSAWGSFDVAQRWLPQRASGVDAAAFTRFVLALIDAAHRDVDQVHGVLLPELALDPTCYRSLCRAVARKLPHLHFLISGVRSETARAVRNTVQVTTFYPEQDSKTKNRRFVEVIQSKHHRWRLDRDQIRRYSLGDALDPCREWWEGIDVHERELNFFVFGAGSCFTTLICEDLARVDPGQRAIRAIGPNIVIALLMDGPQLVSRWPSRSAAVLAEDPGSSVLTVSSLGLIERSGVTIKSASRCVALWKDPSGSVHELDLPAGHHALCLTLTGSYNTEVTLDGREDGGAASYWTLSGVSPVRVSDAPAWV
jgi:hypothetical protein